MATVYIYIGMMKTGSTSIQRFLTDSAGELEKRGYVYPSLMQGYPSKYRDRNGHFLVYRSLLPTEEEKKAEEDALWRRSFDRIAELSGTYENIILSDEIIWYRHKKKKDIWPDIEKELKAINCDFKVIAYIRRQDLFVESYWNQCVKGEPRIADSFDQYIEDGHYNFTETDYYKNLSRIASQIGRDRLIVRVFERSRFREGSLLKDFMSAVGLDMDEGGAGSTRYNEALSGDMAEIKREINSLPSYAGEKNFYCGLAMRVEELNRGLGSFQKADMFRPGARTAFMERYKESNAQVAREFMGWEDGVLFREPVQEKDCWDREVDPFLSDMVRLFASADIMLKREIRELRAENRELKKRIARLESVGDLPPGIRHTAGSVLKKLGLRK